MNDIRAAMVELNSYGKHLTKQQCKTLKGQILSGNITGAMKGLDTLLQRKGK